MIAILGAGGVGRGLASCLLTAGQNPLVVARRASQAQALNEHGLARTGILGERRFPGGSFAAAYTLEALHGQELDWLLVCTKTTAAAALARPLADALAAAAGARRVVLCVNGWGTRERYAELFPRERLYCATVTTGFRQRGDTEVDVTVHGDPVRIGGDAPVDDALRALCTAIERGDLPCQPSEAIDADLWAKMLYNCALNPLGALIGVPYGVLAERAETRAILQAVVAEVFAVLTLTGARTHWSSASEYLEHFFAELLPATALHESSMLQDLRAGRRTEVGALTGAVGALAREHGLQTPVCNALTRLVLAREEHMAKLN